MESSLVGFLAAKGIDISTKELPLIENWHPAHCGEIDIRIDKKGDWYHQGSKVKRKALIRLFSTILRREGDQYFLVTPVEKMQIQVEDVPFLANRLEVKGKGEEQELCFITNVDDLVVANLDHQIRMESSVKTQEPRPYIVVRNGLDALISRSVYYQLVDMAEQRDVENRPIFGVWSCKQWFKLGEA